jgi:hypothetical protein
MRTWLIVAVVVLVLALVVAVLWPRARYAGVPRGEYPPVVLDTWTGKTYLTQPEKSKP